MLTRSLRSCNRVSVLQQHLSCLLCNNNSPSLVGDQRAVKPLAAGQQRRNLSLHEYLSMGVLRQYDIATPDFKPAFSADEAKSAAQAFPSDKLVLKAQVLAGGRGKGHFEGGLQGGVQMVDSAAQASDYAGQMIGNKLITKQSVPPCLPAPLHVHVHGLISRSLSLSLLWIPNRTGARGRICNGVSVFLFAPWQRASPESGSHPNCSPASPPWTLIATGHAC